MSFSRIIEANGVVFLTLFGILSLAALTVIVWRFWLNYNAKTDLGEFIDNFKQTLAKEGRQSALELCEEEPGIIPRLFATVIQNCDQGKVATRNAIANLVELEIVPELNFLLPWMVVLAKLSPMVGLLGTVSGMIMAFGKIAGATKVNPSDLAGDIGMALFTTAEGLVIAIPLIFAYSMFRERVGHFELDLQRASHAALSMLPAMKSKA